MRAKKSVIEFSVFRVEHPEGPSFHAVGLIFPEVFNVPGVALVERCANEDEAFARANALTLAEVRRRGR